MKQFSNRWALNAQDFIAGLIMAVIGGLVNILLVRFTSGNFQLSWEVIWHGALVAGATYLSYKFPQAPPKSVEVDASKTVVIAKSI
ncbi:MAG: hypothetical protein WCJ95_09655 [Mariniphaga sp.]